MKAELPARDPEEVQEAQQRARQSLNEQKEESRSLLSGGQGQSRPPVSKPAPMKSAKVVGRNARVTVQYTNGSIKKDIKYKKVEDDIMNNKCVMIKD